MNRRNFLGWLGGTAGALAIYKSTPDVTAARVDPATPDPYRSMADTCPSQQFVIRNEGQMAMQIHSVRIDRIGDTPRRDRYSRPENYHAGATILLPGEELTITASELRS